MSGSVSACKVLAELLFQRETKCGFPIEVTAAVAHLARIHYVSVEDCRVWNANRRDGELRLLTGWCWSERRGEQRYRQGFKSMTVCTRDAYYHLVLGTEVPSLARPRLRVVPSERKTA